MKAIVKWLTRGLGLAGAIAGVGGLAYLFTLVPGLGFVTVLLVQVWQEDNLEKEIERLRLEVQRCVNMRLGKED